MCRLQFATVCINIVVLLLRYKWPVGSRQELKAQAMSEHLTVLVQVGTWIFNILCFVSHISHCCLKHNFERTENVRQVFNRDLKITFCQADSPVQGILLNPFRS